MTPEYKNKPALQDYFNEAKATKSLLLYNDIERAINSAAHQHSWWKKTSIKAGIAVVSVAAMIILVTIIHKNTEALPGANNPVRHYSIQSAPTLPDDKKETGEVKSVALTPAYLTAKHKTTTSLPAATFQGALPEKTTAGMSQWDSGAIDIRKVHPLILSKKDLHRLRISINPSGAVCRNMGPVIVCYEKYGTVIASSRKENDSLFELQFKSHGATRVDALKVDSSYIAEAMITDDLGKSVRAYSSNDQGKNYGKSDINTLIPVLVRTGLDYNAEDEKMHHWRPDVIFWFAPTQQFFDALPDSIRNTLAAEYKYITSTPAQKEKLAVSNCEYFEQCRATLNDISAINIYPNPAEREFHVAFSSAKEQSISIELTNVAGEHVAGLMPMRHIEKGNNDLRLDLPPMPSGMYLLIISSMDGKVVTERLVRK